MKILFIILLLSICLSGCLEFGENKTYRNAEITPKQIEVVQNTSELKLPSNLTHLKFYYHGDTIDPFWHYKGLFTDGALDEFVNSIEFQKYEKRETTKPGTLPSALDGWWDVDSLNNIIYKEKAIGNSISFIYIGEKNGKTFLYISNYTF